MPKERSINPAAQQRKADKQKEIAKSKKNLQTQRNEKLARRNPERLQKQIDELKEIEQRGGGQLRPKDAETLKQLERDLRGVRKAREVLGDAAPKFSERRDGGRGSDVGGRGGGHGGGDARAQQALRRQSQHLGKRRRDQEEAHNSDSSGTDPEVRSIPMPRDTPPPPPRRNPRERFHDPQIGADGQRTPHALPTKPVVQAKTTYSSAPQIRDLKKEAVRFLPSAVAAQKNRVKGEGRLIEPEEAERLERAGYLAAGKAAEEADREAQLKRQDAEIRSMGGKDVDLEVEARRFEAEISEVFPPKAEGGPRPVQIEDVDDEGD